MLPGLLGLWLPQDSKGNAEKVSGEAHSGRFLQRYPFASLRFNPLGLLLGGELAVGELLERTVLLGA
ncbi:MAG: hypothetical protein Q4F99_07315, partial [bacterium]|nr:hypothetical protein [bacterium]